MFDLSASSARPKRSFLTWVGTACMIPALYFLMASDGFSPLGALFFIAGNILTMVDNKQKKEPQLPRLLAQ